jgi:hypothetical protein
MSARTIAFAAPVIAVAVVFVLVTGILGSGSSDTSRELILFSELDAAPVGDAEAMGAGFTVVHSKSELYDVIDDSTRAIIVTAAQLPQLDHDWIHGQYASGKVMAAINVPAGDWANTVGGTIAGSPPNTEWPEPYVSIASGVDCPGGGGGSRGIASGPVVDAIALAEFIGMKILQNDAACD